MSENTSGTTISVVATRALYVRVLDIMERLRLSHRNACDLLGMGHKTLDRIKKRMDGSLSLNAMNKDVAMRIENRLAAAERIAAASHPARQQVAVLTSGRGVVGPDRGSALCAILEDELRAHNVAAARQRATHTCADGMLYIVPPMEESDGTVDIFLGGKWCTTEASDRMMATLKPIEPAV